MLSKLIKHEFKATARLLLPLYFALAVLTIMDRIVLSLKLSDVLFVIPVFITVVYVVSIVAIIVVSFVIIIYRFYKNLMTDEGYLMFTLPVKPHQLINSKLLVSLLWSLTSAAAVILSLLGVFATAQRFDMLREGWNIILAEMKLQFGTGNLALLIIELAVSIVLAIVSSILTIYASIAVGQLFNGHRAIASFAAYIGITAILQIIVTAAMIAFGLIFGKALEDINTVPQIIFPITILFAVITSVLFYWLTNFIFKRKLNLE